jgi:hypothetical protein
MGCDRVNKNGPARPTEKLFEGGTRLRASKEPAQQEDAGTLRFCVTEGRRILTTTWIVEATFDGFQMGTRSQAGSCKILFSADGRRLLRIEQRRDGGLQTTCLDTPLAPLHGSWVAASALKIATLEFRRQCLSAQGPGGLARPRQEIQRIAAAPIGQALEMTAYLCASSHWVPPSAWGSAMQHIGMCNVGFGRVLHLVKSWLPLSSRLNDDLGGDWVSAGLPGIYISANPQDCVRIFQASESFREKRAAIQRVGGLST